MTQPNTTQVSPNAQVDTPKPDAAEEEVEFKRTLLGAGTFGPETSADPEENEEPIDLTRPKRVVPGGPIG